MTRLDAPKYDLLSGYANQTTWNRQSARTLATSNVPLVEQDSKSILKSKYLHLVSNHRFEKTIL